MVKINPFKIIALAALGLLASCTTPNEAVNLPDGARAYRITCGGAYSSVSECYEKAGSICGSKGYAVVHETDISPPGDTNFFWNAAAHETVIKCNNGIGGSTAIPLNSTVVPLK